MAVDLEQRLLGLGWRCVNGRWMMVVIEPAGEVHVSGLRSYQASSLTLLNIVLPLMLNHSSSE
jgi:hypothetical protein